MIKLNGVLVPGYNTKVSGGFKLKGEDLSGAGSYLVNSDNGIKATVLSVTTYIPFIDQDQLASLITQAKALDENGARLLYTVNCEIAAAFKMRKAIFDSEVKADEMEDLKGWKVTFRLSEKFSKSEREQQQLDQAANSNATSQQTDGHNVVQQQFENTGTP